MVARDEDDGNPESQDDAVEHVIEQRDRLDRRHGAVVDVARNEQGLGATARQQLDQLVEYIRLILGQVAAVEEAAQVPV